MGRAHTTEQFITDAKKVHGELYDQLMHTYGGRDALNALIMFPPIPMNLY